MKQFGDCNHTVINRDAAPQHNSVFLSSSLIQHKLNKLSSEIFPILPQTSVTDTQVNNLLKYQLIPASGKGYDRKESQAFNAPIELDYIDTEMPPVIPKTKWETIVEQFSDQELEVVFLGTGAAMPSKYRSVSGIFVNLFQKGGILMDCGEGTLGQLYRVYGKSETENILKNLRIIWISHLHADHHLGMAKLMKVRQELAPKHRIVVVGPNVLGDYLTEFSACCEMGLEFDMAYIHDLSTTQVQPYQDALHDMNITLSVVTVDHSCRHSYACVITYRDFPIVYSGDTRPCENLKQIQNCGLLIHEATFEDELQDEAIKKKHSTTGEAIQVGAAMGAWRTILTHFSQRYPKIPVLDEFGHSVMIAFDLMRVNIKQLSQVPRLLTPIRKLFAEELKDMSEAKR